MRTASRLVSSMGLALVLLEAGYCVAQEACRYNFATPTLDGLLRKYRAVRLVVVMRDAGIDARHAAKSLSLDVRRRGVQVVIMGAPRRISPRELAVTEAKDKDAQLVALIDVPPDASPKVATAELRDAAGELLAIFISEATRDETCTAGSATTIAEARDPFEAGVASGQEPAEDQPPADQSKPPRTWYGWQVALADLGTLLLRFTPVRRFAWVTYFLAPPAVHAANGQGKGAGLSLGLRLATPFVAAGVGVLAVYAGICPKDGNRITCAGGVVAGPFIAGMVLAALADGGLAWKVADEPSDRVAARPGRSNPGLTFGVGMFPYRQGAGLGLAGRF